MLSKLPSIYLWLQNTAKMVIYRII